VKYYKIVVNLMFLVTNKNMTVFCTLENCMVRFNISPRAYVPRDAAICGGKM
jgi:hypothetical protein